MVVSAKIIILSDTDVKYYARKGIEMLLSGLFWVSRYMVRLISDREVSTYLFLYLCRFSFIGSPLWYEWSPLCYVDVAIHWLFPLDGGPSGYQGIASNMCCLDVLPCRIQYATSMPYSITQKIDEVANYEWHRWH